MTSPFFLCYDNNIFKEKMVACQATSEVIMLSQDFLSELRAFVEKEQRQAVDEAARIKQKSFAAQCTRSVKAKLLDISEADQHYPKDARLGPDPFADSECSLDSYIETNKGPGFVGLLFEMIDARGFSDSAVYRKAGIDRRLFSKIRSDPAYHPSKTTVIALGIALEADLNELESLLSEAGYALSGSETFDLIIRYCVEQRVFDLDEINEALDSFQLKPLGGVA